MSKKTSNNSQAIQQQANLWLTRLNRGLSKTEKQQLIAWINQDKAHYSALKKISVLWGDIGTKHELNGLFAAKVSKPSQYISQGFLAAGIVAIALLVSNLLHDINYLWSSPQQALTQAPSYQKYRSQFGEIKHLQLADGSTVELNSNTVIEVMYSTLQRKITLIRGEAKFDVAKDPNRPFTVVTGHNAFTALGTIFNVQRDDISSAQLLVKEGHVLVAKADTPVNALLEAISENQSLSASTARSNRSILSAGEKIVISNNISAATQVLSEQEIQQELAWQQGILIFDGEPLQRVLREVQRYNDVEFLPIDEKLAKLKVSGYFKTQDLQALLQALHYNFAIESKQVANNTYALKQA
ncbi:FecR family protein [Colwellia chukchiensis]|uniref:FecR family protein n=1 Tax=Colwellia chukchiensis TaxID=641665 RepID=A0A1H7J0P3_9GAMM|nr:FecR domain-containing protein [Colwellia chukchiensis]SEK66655.1 FecR family protein [Colwellia chukchiensis]